MNGRRRGTMNLDTKIYTQNAPYIHSHIHTYIHTPQRTTIFSILLGSRLRTVIVMFWAYSVVSPWKPARDKYTKGLRQVKRQFKQGNVWLTQLPHNPKIYTENGWRIVIPHYARCMWIPAQHHTTHARENKPANFSLSSEHPVTWKWRTSKTSAPARLPQTCFETGPLM